MKLDVYWIPVTIIIALVFFTGCMTTPENTNTAAPVITETPLTVATPTPPISTSTPTPMPIRAIVTYNPTPEPEETFEVIEPEWTELPIVYPTANPSVYNQNFTEIKTEDFIALYPETWAIINQSITLSDEQVMVYGIDTYKRDGRMTTLSSEDGNVSMMVTVYDYIAPKRQVYNPTIDTARKKVQDFYPNISADTSVYNFHNQKNAQGIVTSRYDVIFRPDQEYYPYSYTEESWLTFNHYFTVDFVVKTGNLYDYNDLKSMMLASIRTEGMQTYTWWL